MGRLSSSSEIRPLSGKRRCLHLPHALPMLLAKSVPEMMNILSHGVQKKAGGPEHQEVKRETEIQISDSYKTVTCTLLLKPMGPTMLRNKRWAPCFAKDEEMLAIILKAV